MACFSNLIKQMMPSKQCVQSMLKTPLSVETLLFSWLDSTISVCVDLTSTTKKHQVYMAVDNTDEWMAKIVFKLGLSH